jgi:outer membrane receptor for ferrienterochelin and colicins
MKGSVLALLLVAILGRSAPAAEKPETTGVLVVAHGAGPQWNARVEETVARVRLTLPAEAGYLMGTGDKPEQGYARLVAAGVSRVVVVPLFVSSVSDHYEQVRFVGGLRSDYPHAEHMKLIALRGTVPVATVTQALDDHPLVGAILADRAAALSQDPTHESLVIVAHGPNPDDEAAIWTVIIDRLASQVRAKLPFRSVAVRLLRDDAPKPVKDQALQELRDTVATAGHDGPVIVVPLLLAPGHVADEIPATLAGLEYRWDGKTLLPDERIADWVVAQATSACPTARKVGSVTGRIEDSSSAVVPGALVVLRNRDTGLERTTRAGAEGEFAFRGLGAARYRLSVHAADFSPVVRDLEEATGETVVVLEPAPVVEEVTVVSGSREAELRASLNTRVEVITAEQAKDTGHETVGEMLRELPGVLSRRSSEAADAAGEQIQGIDSRQVLVLMDGQPLAGARGIKRGGVLNLDRQSVGRLDRVEVVKGAASALYGSDAIGGVVNLVTRDADRPVEAAASVSGGTRGTLDTRASASFSREKVRGFFDLEHHANDGFDLTPTTPDTTGAATRRWDGLAKLRLEVDQRSRLTAVANGYWNNAKGRSVGELGPERDDVDDATRNVGLTYDGRLSGRTTVQARAYHSRYDETSESSLLDAKGTPLDPGELRERLYKLDVSATHILGERQIIQGGAEWWRDVYRGLNRLRDGSGESVRTNVAWAQDRISVGRPATLTIGLRYDDNSAFGSAWSPKAAINVRISSVASARASYGRGFRAPDLGQLYYRFLNPTNFYQVIGNPGLRPEHANSYQVGGEFGAQGGRGRLGLNVFRNDVRDLIDSVSLGLAATPGALAALMDREGIDPSFRPVAGRLLLAYRNIRDVRTQGVEVDSHVVLPAGFSVYGAYTYLDAEDLATGLELTGRSRHMGTARMSWRTASGRTRANLRGTVQSSWVVSRATVAGVNKDTRASGFSLWDAYLAQRLLRGIEAYAAVDNLANSKDANVGLLDAKGLPLPIARAEAGRSIRLGLRWGWGN